MLKKLLSEMSEQELHDEIKRCQQSAKEAIEDGMLSEYQVYEQRYYMAKSYLMNKDDIQIGATYGIENDTNLFIVEYLRGVLAYGKALGQTEEKAYPIGILVPLDFAPNEE